MDRPAFYRSRNWLLAHYDVATLNQLGLPWNHSQRIADKDFSGYVLVGAYLRSVELSGFTLVEAKLAHAFMCQARLCCADLSGADLRSAQLRGADLKDADIRCANLRGTNLNGADLVGANLIGADLTYADLQDANVAGATFDQADVTARQVRQAQSWRLASYSRSLLADLGLPVDHNARVTLNDMSRTRALRRGLCCATIL